MSVNKLKIFLIVILVAVADLSVTYAAKTIEELNKEKKEIQSRSKETKQQLETTRSEKSDLLKEVESLDAELTVVEEEVMRLSANLEETENRLHQNEADLKSAQEESDLQYAALKKRIRTMYENGNVGYLQVILESKNFSDMLKRVDYVNYIMEYDRDVFANMEATEAYIEEVGEKIRIEKENIEQMKKRQEEKSAELESKRNEKTQLVSQLSSDEAKYMQQLNDWDKADKEITALIQQAEAKKKAEEEAAARARAARAANNSSSTQSNGSNSHTESHSNTVYAPSGGQLQYPVPAYRGYNYNSPYGYRRSPIKGGTEFHTGVDLKATMSTDVIASESGTVIFAGVNGGYGKCVIIDHGGGMSTLYAHNSRLNVSVGQSVQRGQVIANAGTTGYSTGVHVHFEVRFNGKHTNPAPYIGH